MNGKVIVCSFTSTDDLKGKKRTYDALKALVVQVGRFSVFEATQSDRDARMFTKLDKDPELHVFRMGFPWTGVMLRRHWEINVETSLIAISLVWS